VRIAVIGAGLAGLSAARTLQGAGHALVVFDKGRAPSGRLATRRSDGQTFDHGAQYFTARDEGFRLELASWISEGVAAEWTGRIGTLEAGATRPSSGETRRYVGVPSMSAIGRHLARGLTVRSEVRVADIEPADGEWSVRVEGGEGLGRFETVLVTAPAPQAVPLLRACPALADAARQARLRPCWAVLARWPDPLDVPLDGAFVEHPALRWAARNSSKPGRPPGETWVLHARPEWSEAHLEDEPGAVTTRLLAAFAEAVGRPLAPPAFQDAHRWRFALPDPALESPCLYDPEARLGAAGDWCGGPRVEGAVLSGLALARTVLAAPRGVSSGRP
jgi:predicted NAD/FAD-dependent oxidoreductase